MPLSRRGPVLLVAALALGVACGVLGFALVRGPAGPDSATSAGARPIGPVAAPAYAPLGPPMPAGCEVDPANPPVLEFVDLPQSRLSIGARRQDERLQRLVTVRNVGRGVLCVRQVETGCGCVKAAWDGDAHVAPGATGTLTILVDTAGLVGPTEKWVTLYTNDPKRRPGAVLTVAFDVRLGLVVGVGDGPLGALLRFGVHGPGESATTALRLTCPKDEPEWKVVSVESLAPQAHRATIAWEVVPVASKDPTLRAYDLRLTHPGRREIGVDVQPLRVATSDAARPEIRVDAELSVVGKYYAEPTPATFGTVRASATPPSQTIQLSAREPRAFRVTGARIDGAGFSATEPRPRGEGWGVDVRYDGKARPAGRVEATLVVTIDDREVPELRIPLLATATGD